MDKNLLTEEHNYLDKNDDVYVLLEKIGLTNEEIQDAAKRNKFLTKVIDTDIKRRLIWLRDEYDIGLDKVRGLIIENPFLIIEDFTRIRMIERMYTEVGIEKKDIRKIILSNPSSFSINPIELKRYIDIKREDNMTNEEIKRSILESDR